MSVQPKQIEITSPCPITLDRSGASASDRELFCGHCSKEVHLLSHMRESEARAFMAERAGDDICVSYAIRSDGSIRFRPEPQVIPVSALVRPSPASPRPLASPLQRGLSMAASIGAAAWLSACTPHSDERDAEPRAQTEAKEVVDPPIPVEVVAGGITAQPIDPPPVPCDPKDDQLVDGGLKAAPIPEQVAPEPPVADMDKPVPHKAGGLRARPIPGDPLADL